MVTRSFHGATRVDVAPSFLFTWCYTLPVITCHKHVEDEEDDDGRGSRVRSRLQRPKLRVHVLPQRLHARACVCVAVRVRVRVHGKVKGKTGPSSTGVLLLSAPFLVLCKGTWVHVLAGASTCVSR